MKPARSPHPMSTVETARRMHREGDSMVTISRALGVPRSTVGDWVRGDGAERRYVKTCWCGVVFTAARVDAMSCSNAHAVKRTKIFGRVRAGYGQ